MIRFPDLPEPNVSAADNCGDSYTVSYTDNTIKSETDAGYKITRPRNTRILATWTFSWMGVSDDDFAMLARFYKQVGTFGLFTWENPIDEKKYVVRFAEPLSGWQYDHPSGWHGSLKFEEV